MTDELVAPVPAVGVPVPDQFPDSLPFPASSAQIAQFVAHRAAACVGADYANLALLDGATMSLRLFHDSFLDEDMAARYIDVAVDADYPIAAAVREKRVVLLPDIDAYRAQFPDIVVDTITAGVKASASLPLFRPDHTAVGALAFAWTDPTVFHPKLEAALEAVGVLCVETFDRMERYDADHELVVAMQQRLLGDLPLLPGIQTAARYLPANESLAVGGDWYEGLVLGQTRMALVVGDVTGHGIAAAADMALLRGMVSALLHSGVPTSNVFSELAAVLSQRSVLVAATVAVAVVDTDQDTVTFATAGHPPPLLRLPGGEVHRLDTANSPIIGLSGVRRQGSGTAPFPKGSTLLMYTDGLVERRDRPFDEGINLAMSLLHSTPDEASEAAIVEALLEGLICDHIAEDDIALLVTQHTGQLHREPSK